MNFNSWQFLLFLPLVTIGYWLLGAKARNNTVSQTFLLAASLFFYTCWNLAYLALILCLGNTRGERNFLAYALCYVLPQLVAGTIERTGNILPQFKADHGFDYERVSNGLKLATWGMFKENFVKESPPHGYKKVYKGALYAF